MLNKGIRSDLATDVPVFIFTDEATKQKVKRHLQDINDVITEKDIKDAKVPGADDTLFATQSQRQDSDSSKARKERAKQKENLVDDIPGTPLCPGTS